MFLHTFDLEQWLEVDIKVITLVNNVAFQNRATQRARARHVQARVGLKNVGNTNDQVSKILIDESIKSEAHMGDKKLG